MTWRNDYLYVLATTIVVTMSSHSQPLTLSLCQKAYDSIAKLVHNGSRGFATDREVTSLASSYSRIGLVHEGLLNELAIAGRRCFTATQSTQKVLTSLSNVSASCRCNLLTLLVAQSLMVFATGITRMLRGVPPVGSPVCEAVADVLAIAGPRLCVCTLDHASGLLWAYKRGVPEVQYGGGTACSA